MTTHDVWTPACVPPKRTGVYLATLTGAYADDRFVACIFYAPRGPHGRAGWRTGGVGTVVAWMPCPPAFSPAAFAWRRGNVPKKAGTYFVAYRAAVRGAHPVSGDLYYIDYGRCDFDGLEWEQISGRHILAWSPIPDLPTECRAAAEPNGCERAAQGWYAGKEAGRLRV